MKFLLLNLPDPEGYIIQRGWAGALGTVQKVKKGSNRDRFLPIFLVYSASALIRAKADFEIIDGQASGLSYDDFLLKVLLKKPDVVITKPSLPFLESELDLLKKIKGWLPNLKIVCVGGVCNAMHEKLLNNGVDIAVQSRYPYYTAVLDIVESLKVKKSIEKIKGIAFLKNGQVIQNKIEEVNDLDKINFNAYKLIDLKKYLMNEHDIDEKEVRWIPILTAVGCPYNCIYCAYPLAYGRNILYKSTDRVIEEIKYIVENFNITGFCIRDVVFTNDREKVIDFCKRILKEKIKIKFVFETRADLVDDELLKLLKKAGCFKINFGVETGSPEILKIGKPGIDIKMMKNAFKITKAAGILTQAHIILGLPGETRETIEHTLRLLYALNPDGININYATPYPGTALYTLAQRKEWIASSNLPDYTSHNAVLRTEALTMDEIEKFGRRFKLRFTFYKVLHDRVYRKKILRKVAKILLPSHS